MAVWTQVALAGLAGGLLAIERRAFLQAMFSRPLVAATLIGWLLGEVDSGLAVGMVLELFHLGSANLGAALAENETLAATGTAAAAAAFARGSGGGGTAAIWSFSILLFIGLGRGGRQIDRALERYSSRLATRALASAESGNLNRAMRQNLWGMWPHFLIFGLCTAACAALGFWAGPWLQRVPLSVVRGFAWAYPAMASVAAAIAARGSHAKRAALYAGATATAVALSAVLYAHRGMP